MTVRIEHNGAVTTVVLSRPEARNAVDGPTAQALADAFRAFDADPEARLAVLYGEGGSFCACLQDSPALAGQRLGERLWCDIVHEHLGIDRCLVASKPLSHFIGFVSGLFSLIGVLCFRDFSFLGL